MPGQNTTRQPEIVHHLHALLHTFRVIQQQEDEFCTLMHSVERSGKLHAADSRELERLLTQVPAESLLHELDALRAALQLSQPVTAALSADSPEADPFHAD